MATVAIVVLAFDEFDSRDSTPAPAPPPPTVAPPLAPPTAAPTTTVAPTTTTLSECETRRVWLSDDADRLVEAMEVLLASRIELSEASGTEEIYAALGVYVPDYGRALDRWLRVEPDIEELLRDCWDELPADDVELTRNFLAHSRDLWHQLRSHCRKVREVARTTDYPDPWALGGVSC